MSKALALMFSTAGVVMLIGVAAALSYRNLWLALIMIVLYIVVVGVGFVVRARLNRREG